MGKQWFAKFIDMRKRPVFPFAVGLGIACVVFPIAYTLASEWTSNILIFLLMVPGFMASFVLQTDSVFLGALVSSFFYGSMGGFLASNNWYVKLLIYPLILLLIVFSCYIGLLVGLSD